MWPRAVLKVALRGPGKGLLLASATGWIAYGWLLTGDRLPHVAAIVGHGAHSGKMGTAMSHSPGSFIGMWLVMVLAMAPPLLLREIGRLWRTSLRRLRHVTITWFVCGYVGIWLLAGATLSTLFGWLTAGSERITIAVALIVLWHCSPARQRCLNACHRVPTLRAFGTAAEWDSLRYGVSTGCYCTATCGLLMLLVLLANDYHFAFMAVATAVTTLERHLPARRPGWQLPLSRGRSLDWPHVPIAMQA